VASKSVFNGKPDQLDTALSIMIERKPTASKLVATQVPSTAMYATPTFEYNSGGGG
jgi:hypothetical protein